MKILVADDEQSARDTVEALLHVDRYDLEFVTTGYDALARMEGAVDLVLCDVMMPGMDGFDVCRRIKAHPTWRYVPVILMTALDGQDDMVRGIEAGADEFLTKPLDKVVLRARVRAMLRIRAQYGELKVVAANPDAIVRARRDRIVSAANLSLREREVLDLSLLGRTHDDIATVLGISVRTAKFHLSNVLKKLGAESRLDLLRIFL